MKNKLQINPLFLRMAVLVTCFLIVIIYNKAKAADVSPPVNSAKKIAINFKHNLLKDELTIRLKLNSPTVLQFFIFSPDGILVKELAVSNNKSVTIKGLKKGYYLYECFNKDERMKSGNLKIK